MAKLTKKMLDEIIDSNDELIGYDKYPTNGSNLDSKALNTTDFNAGKGHQPFKYDMLARFGFSLLPFFESEEKGNNNLIDDLSKFLYDKRKSVLISYLKKPNKVKNDFNNLKDNKDFCNDTAKEIIDFLKPYIENSLNELNNTLKENIDENTFIEGKVLEKKDDPKDISKEKSKDRDVLDKKIKHLADLINKMDKKNVSKLKNLLEDE